MRKQQINASQKQLAPRLRIRCGREIALGPGKMELLESIERTGSISRAAQAMDMSYMRAWMLIRTMNACFKEPLVHTERGGTKGGGGATLTETGRVALALYRRMNERCLATVQPDWRRLKALLRAA